MLQLRNAELEAELDNVRDEANRRINELEAGNQEQAHAAQQQGQELQARRREVATLEAKLQSRSGVLADHSERVQQLQQVCRQLLFRQSGCRSFDKNNLICLCSYSAIQHVLLGCMTRLYQFYSRQHYDWHSDDTHQQGAKLTECTDCCKQFGSSTPLGFPRISGLQSIHIDWYT